MRSGHLTSLLLLLAVAGTVSAQPLSSTSKMCKTIFLDNDRYLKHRNLTRLYEDLWASYGGCEYVYGDVIFQNVGVDPVTEQPTDDAIRTLNTDFLDSIVEITGKLVIMRVNLESITFKNLRTIRGYNPGNADPFFAIDVMQSMYPLQLRLPRLGAILHGNVRMIGTLHASLYCYMSRRVNWPSLFQASASAQKFLDDAQYITFNTTFNTSIQGRQVAVRNYLEIEVLCSSLPKCDTACHTEKTGRQLCWSSGADGCQSYHRCSTRTCRNNYCFRNSFTGDEECCDPSCLGGCISEKPSDCFSCRKVSLDGSCTDSCPTKSYYNAETGRMETLNSSMWQVGNMCMKKCQMPFVSSSDGKYCLSECPSTEIPINDVCTGCAAKGQDSCVTCNFGTRDFIFFDDRAQEFRQRNCTIWRTATTSLDVDPTTHLLSNRSLETLELVQIFYGKLMIKRTERLVNNLRFLRNIRHVSGGLDIMMLKTQYLGLTSLQSASKMSLRRISGLCPGWFPRKRIEQLRKRITINEAGLTFDNSSAECRNATCDTHCLEECWGPGPDMCVECRNFKVDGRCYATCQEANKYPENATCLACHSECVDGCSGPTASKCVRCKHFKEYGSCVATCSQGMRADSKDVCYSIASARLVGVGVGVGLLLLILIVLLPLIYLYYRRRMQKYEWVDLDEYLTDPSNPNDMARLRIVNDDDVVKQKEIGSGAFGTVFKGVLRSNTVKGVRELPVAIKVLRGHSPKLGQELLNEARVLARVRHPYCIRLVALCLTEDLQLITALMPRGCLLEFLRTHRNRIGAERMLRWGLQVAEGMEYLESLGIIHRDLAARNVLLQTPDQVRITDFGLARLLDLTESEFVHTAGLLPVKWLGQECLESGLFSHKSDVWSYGVLLWEICTFGESPYNPYGIRSVEDITGLLKKGIRLNQPDVCSIDFFNIMLSCWLPHPESRPSFKDMVSTMNECMLIPSKYIAVGRSTIDASQIDANEVLGFESEPAKQVQKDQGKHLELNTHICDPTTQPPRQRNAPRFATQNSDASEAAALLRTLSSDDADGYLTPKSSTEMDNHPHGPGGGGGLEDYLTPTNA